MSLAWLENIREIEYMERQDSLTIIQGIVFLLSKHPLPGIRQSWLKDLSKAMLMHVEFILFPVRLIMEGL